MTGSEFESNLSEYEGLILEFDVSQASAVPLVVSIDLYTSVRYYSFGLSLALPPPDSPDNTVYEVGVRFDNLEGKAYGRSCGSLCQLSLNRLTGLSVGVIWQEGPFEVRVLSVKASKSVMERPDMYYERFVAKSTRRNLLGCDDDISTVTAAAEYAKQQNYPDIGVSMYTALATQFSLGATCTPTQKGLVLSALEESRTMDSMTSGFGVLKSAFQKVREWESSSPPPVHHIHIDGGVSGWDEGSWNLVLDSVMGGKSRGEFSFSDESLLFSGTVDTNGGGFVQIQKHFPKTDFSSADGIVVEVKALDPAVARAPLALAINVHDSSRYSYQAPLVIPLASSGAADLDAYEVGAKWDSFVGRWYGQKCTDGCQLDTSSIQQVTVSIVYQDGPFMVELVSIAGATGIFDSQDMYTVLLESHPSQEVLQPLVGVVMEKAAFLNSHGFDGTTILVLVPFPYRADLFPLFLYLPPFPYGADLQNLIYHALHTRNRFCSGSYEHVRETAFASRRIRFFRRTATCSYGAHGRCTGCVDEHGILPTS
jgi:hypothetical protein